MGNSSRNEISLKEIWSNLWKAKYMIAGFTIGFIALGIILSFFIVPTAYEATVYIDPSLYGISHFELLHEAKRTAVVDEAARGFAEKTSDLIKGTTLESVKDTRYIKIKVTYHDRDAAVGIAEKVGLEVLQLARDMRLERIIKDKERTERILAYFEEEPFQEGEKGYMEERPSERLIILEMDPIIKMELEQKADALGRLRSLNFEICEMMAHPDYEPENWIRTSPVIGRPVNKTAYIILAAFFGLALSCFIALIRESWAAETDAKEPGAGV